MTGQWRCYKRMQSGVQLRRVRKIKTGEDFFDELRFFADRRSGDGAVRMYFGAMGEQDWENDRLLFHQDALIPALASWRAATPPIRSISKHAKSQIAEI